MKQSDLQSLVEPLVLEGPEDEVRVVVMEVEAEQVLVLLCRANLDQNINHLFSGAVKMRKQEKGKNLLLIEQCQLLNNAFNNCSSQVVIPQQLICS